ncbi:hypothetical protein SAMN05892883_2527 [Jatrophihabitans sp. GAS493]|uniref:CoA-binding protein n=1 Tax=Jatrophihabitans sp. GAS493 TaxID=1907575 RepID=UPI000BC09FC8|nr:CoA-binding protein [Jatrophihabitans sp. GAS493]SOD73237.1 hypothetical protein SAMN05892883_2527 [Jatrophihabitans sp. GAS493]
MTEMNTSIAEILGSFATITVVGASADPAKAAHYVPAHMQRHGWRILPVNPRRPEIFGTTAYASLDEVEEPVEFVNVFRPSAQTPDVVRQAVAIGAKAVWLQLDIYSAEAREIAHSAGLIYVEDRCLLVEQRRL